MAVTTSANNPVISKEALVKYGVKFSLGASIMKLGERKFEKELGADQMSGDTVYFCEADGGLVIDNRSDLNISSYMSNNKLEARRTKKKALTLQPIIAVRAMTQEDMELLINKNEFGDKMMAEAIQSVEKKSYAALLGASSAEKADDADGIIDAFMKAQAYLESSLVDGEICGCCNTWNDLAISSAYAKKGIDNHGVIRASQQTGLDAGNGFMGFKWAKMTAGQNGKITAPYYNSTGAQGGTATTCTALTGRLEADGSAVITGCTLTNPPPAISVSGSTIDIEAPFQIAGINVCDELGADTGIPMSFLGKSTYASSTTATVVFDKEVRFNVGTADATSSGVIDPLANAVKPSWLTIGISGGSLSLSISSAPNVTGVLTAGSDYYKPVLLWKKSEFLVAVKGLKPMDATTESIPASFGGDKGIVPWRGTTWWDKEKSKNFSRFDALFGFGYRKGIAVRAIYIKAV